MTTQESDAKRIFLEAVEQYKPDQWPGFLDQACQSDSALRDHVEALLKAHGEPNQMLDGTGVVAAVELAPVAEQPGPAATAPSSCGTRRRPADSGTRSGTLPGSGGAFRPRSGDVALNHRMMLCLRLSRRLPTTNQKEVSTVRFGPNLGAGDACDPVRVTRVSEIEWVFETFVEDGVGAALRQTSPEGTVLTGNYNMPVKFSLVVEE